MAEEGASLSSGSLRLYASLITHHPSLIVGCIDLYSYDPLNRRCAVGIMVSSEHRRQGHALAMLHALENLYSPTQPLSNSATQQPTHPATLHTLYADIAATNAASRALFSKAGYTECGHFRDWLLVGDRYIDSIRMQLIL
jgi:diamine N-acetyltransferase